MAVTKKMMNAVDGYDKPFSSDSDMIQVKKQKLTDGTSKATNGTGIEILSTTSDVSAEDKACINVASFSINT